MTIRQDKSRFWIGITPLAVGVGIFLGYASIGLPISDAKGIIAILVIITWILIVGRRQPKQVRYALIVALGLRLALALFQAYVAPLPDSQSDALGFERVGWELAQGWHQGMPFVVHRGAHLYSTFIGMVYWLFGRVPLIIQCINVLLGTLVVLNVYRIARRLGGARSGQWAAWATALFPTLNLYSAITMREMFIIYGATWALWYLWGWYSTAKVKHFVWSSLWLLFCGALNSAFTFGLLVYGGLVLMRWLRVSVARLRGRWRQTSWAAVILVSLAFIVVITGIGLEKLGRVRTQGLSGAVYAQASRAHGRAVYLEGLHPDRSSDIVWQLPIRVAYFLFAPFPWMIHSPLDLVGLADALLYLVLVIWIWRRRSVWKDWRALAPLLLLFFVWLAVFSMGTFNYGTAIRHRASLVWLLIIWGSASMSQTQKA